MSLTSSFIRKVFKRSDDKRDAGLGTPQDIQRFDDIRYGGDARWQLLDLYCPKGESGRLPVIVSVHGGYWIYGDKETYQYYCMSLAQRGFAVLNYSYRLAPEHKFPACLEDTCLVFRWVLEHAEEYGLDNSHVFAVGDSAGAHILSLFCCMCTDADYAARYPFSAPAGFVPTALGLNCGMYEIKKGGRRELNTRVLEDFLPEKGTAEELELIDVLRHVNSAFPPSFVMTSTGDMLKEPAAAMTAKLREQGVAATYRCYGDEKNRLGHVFHCNTRLPDAARCNDDECAFFKSFL